MDRLIQTMSKNKLAVSVQSKTVFAEVAVEVLRMVLGTCESNMPTRTSTPYCEH